MVAKVLDWQKGNEVTGYGFIASDLFSARVQLDVHIFCYI